MFSIHIKQLEEQYGQKIKAFYFRDKTSGWDKSAVRIVFEDGSEVTQTRKENDFYCLFENESTYFRKCCLNCKFKNFNTVADITFGDYWGIDEVSNEFSDDKGCSMVMIHTEKGAKLFSDVSKRCDLVIPTTLEFAIKTHPRLIKSLDKSPYTKLFFKDLRKHSFSHKYFHQIVEKYCSSSLLNRIKRKLEI